MRKVIILLLLTIIGCAPKLYVFHLWDFEKSKVLQGHYDMKNDVTVAMPGGEILMGKYCVVDNSSFTFGSATATSGLTTASSYGYGYTISGRVQVYALLKSKTSDLMMEIIVSYGQWTRQGFGEARTNDGRSFKVQILKMEEDRTIEGGGACQG